MRTKIQTTVLGALIALLLVPGAGAQEAQDAQGEFKAKIDVREVLLDVLVTDKKGNVILGLKPEDFVVREGEDSVNVNSATFYSNRRFVESADIAARLGVSPQEVPVDRFFVLFFHDARRNATALIAQQMDAVRRAEKWVFNELLPNDYVAVVRYDAKLMIHQDFTTDNDKILSALEGVAKGKDPGAIWPSRQKEHVGPSLTKNLPEGNELRDQTKRIYAALQVTAEAAGYIKGRKNMLLFSLGFGELNDFGTYVPDPRYYKNTMQLLNDNNVAVYSISLFRDALNQNPAIGDLESGLSLLASETGGRYFFNFANFDSPLRQVVEDNSGYYLLSYSAQTPAGESGYREVEIETVNPDFVVKGRQGYRFGAG